MKKKNIAPSVVKNCRDKNDAIGKISFSSLAKMVTKRCHN